MFHTAHSHAVTQCPGSFVTQCPGRFTAEFTAPRIHPMANPPAKHACDEPHPSSPRTLSSDSSEAVEVEAITLTEAETEAESSVSQSPTSEAEENKKDK